MLSQHFSYHEVNNGSCHPFKAGLRPCRMASLISSYPSSGSNTTFNRIFPAGVLTGAPIISSAQSRFSPLKSKPSRRSDGSRLEERGTTSKVIRPGASWRTCKCCRLSKAAWCRPKMMAVNDTFSPRRSTTKSPIRPSLIRNASEPRWREIGSIRSPVSYRIKG